MYELILEQREESASSRLVINCGMHHAQKTIQMGGKNEGLGSWLTASNEADVYSIVFVGLAGETKMGHWYNEISKFNVTAATQQRDLVHILGAETNNLLSFLELKDPIFEQEMSVTYHHGESYSVRPAEQYEAVIVFPEIHVVKSMKDRGFEGY